MMNDNDLLLKVEGIKLLKKQLNLIALVAENVSVCVIKEGEVEEKVNVHIPSILEGIVKCPNIGCITNDSHERVAIITHRFSASLVTPLIQH